MPRFHQTQQLVDTIDAQIISALNVDAHCRTRRAGIRVEKRQICRQARQMVDTIDTYIFRTRLVDAHRPLDRGICGDYTRSSC